MRLWSPTLIVAPRACAPALPTCYISTSRTHHRRIVDSHFGDTVRRPHENYNPVASENTDDPGGARAAKWGETRLPDEPTAKRIPSTARDPDSH